MTSKTFLYTGAVQTFTVPDQCTSVTVDLWGANNATGSLVRGGRVTGTLAVTPGEVLRIYVGGLPASYNPQSAGGWNGGGAGGTWGGVTGLWGCPGSGATDIRQGGTALSNRKAVAGGAGGGINVSGVSGVGNSSNPTGGPGGANTGGSGANSTGTGGGSGGTQSAGGAGGGNGASGSLGNGGNGGTFAGGASPGGGGAGGGYYGGGGGGGSATNSGGGGGGSNYVGGLTGVTNNLQASAGRPSGVSTGAAVLTYNLAPNVPQPVSPSSGTSIDKALATVFTWTFSDPDSGDTQTKADFRWRVGTGAWTTVLSAATTASSYTAAGNTWLSQVGQSVEWQVQTYDSSNASSGWSASSFFTPQNAPDTPTFSPIPAISSNTPSVTVVRPSGLAIAQYELRVLNDVAGAPGASVLADSGVKNTVGAPTSVTANMPSFAYVNGTNYHLQVKVANPANVWSAWFDSGALPANINAPLAPTLVVTPIPGSGAVTIAVTNPGGDPHPPAFNRLYRLDQSTGIESLIRDNWATSSSYTDYTVGFNRTFSYRAEAWTSAGAVSSSS